MSLSLYIYNTTVANFTDIYICECVCFYTYLFFTSQSRKK